MTDYIVTQKITGGPYTGQALSDVHPTITGFDDFQFDWTLPDDFGTFASLGIIGFKVVGQFAGSGPLGWNWSADNPGAPLAPQWPSPDGDDYRFLTVNGTAEAAVVVDGPTTFEWVFAVSDTASDPTYEGISYATPLADLEISLHALASGVDGYNHVYGRLDGNDEATAVVVLRWDLVLFTAATSTVVIGSDLLAATPVTRLWPRDDNLGLGTASRIHPPPRANRIIGGQP